MKSKTKKIITWLLIGIPALLFMIYGIMSLVQGKLFYGILTIVLTLIWLIGDGMLAMSKRKK